MFGRAADPAMRGRFMARQKRSDKVLAQHALRTLYQIESRRFALWLPVALGFGIWLWFAAPTSPDGRWAWLGLVPAALIATGRARRAGWGLLAVSWLALTVALGFGAAHLAALRAEAPAIAHPQAATVDGRVIEISRSASGAPRFLLDRLAIYGVEPDETPARLRLTWLDADGPAPSPGTRIRAYATLMPTGAPVEPGAFDFRRQAYFDRLGGVGLIRGGPFAIPTLGPEGWTDRAHLWLARLRYRISLHLQTTIPGRAGAFAAAIVVGDRAAISDADAEALRASNLAHLLAISGLHMGMLTGLVFALARLLFAAVPWTAHHFSTRKTAAVVALGAGAAYLALSGATVATQRAFVMVAFAFLAILADRPAITLRALALAATVILLIRPVSLMEAGFQMSFAATIVLVAGYEVMRERGALSPGGGAGRRILLYLGGLLFSSALAGLATAPIAAYHFNRTAPFGLVANLLAVPVMGLWIAPCACLAAMLTPFGLQDAALRAMGAGIEWVLRIAHWIGDTPGATQPVAVAPGSVLALIVVGGLWLALWRGPWRLAGIAGIVGALVLWSDPPPRPDVLIGPGGRIVGVLGLEGRALSHDRAQSYAAKSWLRRDGDGANQAMAAERPGIRAAKGRLSVKLAPGREVHVLTGRRPEEAIADLCRPGAIVIARYGRSHDGSCRYLGRAELRRSGALAIRDSPAGARIVTASEHAGDRRWTRRH